MEESLCVVIVLVAVTTRTYPSTSRRSVTPASKVPDKARTRATHHPALLPSRTIHQPLQAHALTSPAHSHLRHLAESALALSTLLPEQQDRERPLVPERRPFPDSLTGPSRRRSAGGGRRWVLVRRR